MRLLFALTLGLLVSIGAQARGPAINDDVAGIRLGDARGIEDTINRRAKPWLRVFYEDDRVVAVIYRQPGLSNEAVNQRAFVDRLCSKYGENNFCSVARRDISDPDTKWVGFASLYTVEGGYLTARVRREDTFSFFPRLLIEIELRAEGYELPK